MSQRLTKSSLLLAAVLAAGCASAPNPGFGEDVPNDIELVLVNDYRSTVSAHLQWQQSTPQPLGEVPAGESRRVRVPIRGLEVRVFYALPGRAAGDPREPGYFSIRRGDQIEWRLGSDRFVLARRLNE